MNPFLNLAFLVHLLCCIYMSGVIVLIHFVHYPGFLKVDENGWVAFHHHHTRAMGFLVGPIMVLELATAFFLPVPLFYKGLNIFALLLIWIVTFFQAVPCHNKLRNKKSILDIDQLLRANRARTVLWLVRSLALSVLFLKHLDASL